MNTLELFAKTAVIGEIILSKTFNIIGIPYKFYEGPDFKLYGMELVKTIKEHTTKDSLLKGAKVTGLTAAVYASLC